MAFVSQCKNELHRIGEETTLRSTSVIKLKKYEQFHEEPSKRTDIISKKGKGEELGGGGKGKKLTMKTVC